MCVVAEALAVIAVGLLIVVGIGVVMERRISENAGEE